MTTYTIVAYREDGVDTCRGCVMGRSSSGFDMQSFQSMEDAVSFWAKKRMEDVDREREVCAWEITLLIDGLSYDDWCGVFDDTEEPTPPYDAAQKLYDVKVRELLAAKAEAERQAKEAQERKQAAEQVRQAQARKDREFAEYQRLRAQFGQ